MRTRRALLTFVPGLAAGVCLGSSPMDAIAAAGALPPERAWVRRVAEDPVRASAQPVFPGEPPSAWSRPGRNPMAAAGELNFAEQFGLANPLLGGQPYYTSGFVFGDLDGDGDPDAIEVSALSLYYRKNLGTPKYPRFDAGTLLETPWGGRVSSRGSAALADLDGDGDLDLIVRTRAAAAAYFENVGPHSDQHFIERFGGENPLALTIASDRNPAAADIDDDGDIDMFFGLGNGGMTMFENIGTPTSPVFVRVLGPEKDVSVPGTAVPAFGDLDGDGDQDLLVGSTTDGHAHFFENVGAPGAAQFVEVPDHPFLGTGGPESWGSQMPPGIVDMDGDGDLDVVSGNRLLERLSYEPRFFANAPVFDLEVLTDDVDPIQVLPEGRDVPVTVTVRNLSAQPRQFDAWARLTDEEGQWPEVLQGPWRVTLDPGEAFVRTLTLDVPESLPSGEGTYEVSVGRFPDRAIASRPIGLVKHSHHDVFRPFTGADNPFDGIDVGWSAAPTFGDLDADGDLDAFVGNSGGTPFYFENVGDAANASFIQRTGPENPLGFLSGGASCSPALADLDADGDLDAMVATRFVGFRYCENQGTPQAPEFGPVVLDPFSLSVDDFEHSDPTFVDMDLDGDQDLFVGSGLGGGFGGCYGYVVSWENVGSPASPSFSDWNWLVSICTSDHQAVAFVDLRGDGDWDALVGDSYGRMFALLNVGQGQPVFEHRLGLANPLDFAFFAGGARPATGDLDGDGDLDLIVGDYRGRLSYFRNDSVPPPLAGSASDAVSSPLPGTPLAPGLAQNRPNPFDASTTIRFVLPDSRRVRLGVFDVAGRRVASLVDGVRGPGAHSVAWTPGALPSGVYFYRLEAGDLSRTLRMLRIR